MINHKWSVVLLLVFLHLSLNSWADNVNPTSAKGPSSIAKPLKTITIQVASLKYENKAGQELTRLKSHDLDAFVHHESVAEKGMWYRIYVGKFENRDEAKKFAQKIKDRGIISGFWIKQIEIPVDPVKPSQTAISTTEKPDTKTDTLHEKQVPPAAVVETPKTVLPSETKPSRSQPLAEKSNEQTLSPPVPPVEKPKRTMTKKELKEIFPAEDIHDKQPISPVQGIAVQGPGEQEGSSKFSVGVKSSYFLASDTKDFKIKRTDGGDQYSWSIKSPKVYNSLLSNYQINPTISIEAGIERAFFTKLDIWHLTMGPKFEFKKIGMLTPYAKGSLVMGHMKWDDAPGDFDTAWGWEGGFGVSFSRSNIQFGLETSYRAITYDYNRPSDNDVTATDNQIDFSGFALSATMRYRF